MNSSPSPLRRVFVLGAGASKAAGLPLAAEIVPEILATPEAAFPLKTWSETAKWGQEFLRSMADDRTWVSASGLQRLDIEQILNCLTFAADLGIPLPELSGTPLGPSAAMAQVVWLVLMLLELKTPDALPPEFVTFSSRLAREDTVVTFNYDLLVDRAIAARFGRIDYGPLQAEYVPPESHRADCPQLLKLHGSANWRFCEDGGKNDACGKTFAYSPDARLPAYGYEVVRVCECKKGGLRTPIIPPVALKRLTAAPFRELWASASEAISRADEVYIVGYSLPAYDVLSKELLRLSRARNTHGRFVVVNPDPMTAQRFDVLGPGLSSVAMTFSDWVLTL